MNEAQPQAAINYIRRRGTDAVVALQGCNLNCLGCTHSEMQNVCFDCGKCAETCPTHALELENGKVLWEPVACCECGTCVKNCIHRASPMVRFLPPNAVWWQAKAAAPCLQTLYLAGGEAAQQPQFVAALCALAHAEGVRCEMKTNGTVSLPPALLAAVDGVTVHLKPWGVAEFYKWTSRHDNSEVPRTLAALCAAGKLQVLRFVVLPRMMDAEAVLQGAAGALGEGAAKVPLQLVPFTNHGVRGRLAKAPGPDAAAMQQLLASAKAHGFAKAEICCP